MPLDFVYALFVKTMRKAFSEKSNSRSPASQSKVVSMEHLPVPFSCLNNVAFMTSSNSIGNIFPLIDRERSHRRGRHTTKRGKQIRYQSFASNSQECVLRTVVQTCPKPWRARINQVILFSLI